MTEWSALGIPQMIVILALLWGSLWKQGWLRVVTSLCLIIWGVFAMEYDIKIAAPLIGIGTVLFIEAILRQVQNSREEV